MDVIGRRSDTHRVPGPAPDQFSSGVNGGVISPDGDLAALVTQAATDTDTVVLHLIDLGSGTDHATRVTLRARQQPAGAMAWSPDSQWLVVADATGHIVAVDRAGHTLALNTRMPPIEQLTIRY
jgi:Tol biopolymer transport system component